MKPMSDFVTIGHFITRDEAAIARGLLEAEGVAAVVPEFHQFSAMPHIGFGEGFRLQVRAEDEAHAKAILSDAQLAPARDE
jgi:Putative prokaryotic signal transducing protein